MDVKIAKSFWTTGIFSKKYRYFRWWHAFVHWCHMHFCKESWALLWQWFKGYPWDSSFLLDLEQAKLKEMIAYHKKRKFFVGWEQVVRDMQICVSLIDIINEKKSLFTYTGNTEFSEPNEQGEVEWLPGNLEYHCLVKVNTKNTLRFVDKKHLDFYKRHPHELYIQKAKALYYKIRYEKTDQWWD